MYLRKEHGWTPLLDAITTVLFYDGWQDPLLPSRKSRSNRDCPSHDWSSIPAGFTILTASLPCLTNACEQFNSDSGHSSESRSRGDTADRRNPRPARKKSAMRNRDSIELGEEDTGLENRLQVARWTSLDQQELVIHRSPWRHKPTPQRRSPPLQRASSNPIWCKVM